ncbi:MAG: hypothetical protein DI630_37005 [Gordonia sp. (in: high G+C Gram-positive bacteria)]|nr:MAG: hypothetical protein DI630_37005 [Gordonia sp. (in: high G+C Gram-positive bacteria)]
MPLATTAMKTLSSITLSAVLMAGVGMTAPPSDEVQQHEASAVVSAAQDAIGLEINETVPAMQDEEGVVSAPIAITIPIDIDRAIPSEGEDVVAERDPELEDSAPVEIVTEDSMPSQFDSLGLVSVTQPGTTTVVGEQEAVALSTEHGLRVAQAHDGGSLRVHHILDSAGDPHRFPFDLELGASTRAVPTGDGGIDVIETLEDDGSTTDLLVGRLEAPWAVDAEGNPVATRYEVEGDQIYQVVERDPDLAYPIVADPFWIPAAVIALRVGSVVLKVGSKTVRYSKAPASRVTNALKSYRSLNFRAGSHTFKLDKSAMKHILERHHPKYWNGTTKKTQTFFNANMSLNDVRSLVHAAMKQKASTLRSQGTNATFTVSGRVDGVNYTMRISKGRVVQFYPR